ncbi:hypothetical protein AVEN_49669-1 [Araneus ventricosus]|uniref:Uncharacterized protein n=1 Tax=Araneus ventricosus TaxID=182803 RepID=A0A4Y2JL99_ARAVE|nr:hypothetical protein AVEN_49669-1 [Araneus ventricosus]
MYEEAHIMDNVVQESDTVSLISTSFQNTGSAVRKGDKSLGRFRTSAAVKRGVNVVKKGLCYRCRVLLMREDIMMKGRIDADIFDMHAANGDFYCRKKTMSFMRLVPRRRLYCSRQLDPLTSLAMAAPPADARLEALSTEAETLTLGHLGSASLDIN